MAVCTYVYHLELWKMSLIILNEQGRNFEQGWPGEGFGEEHPPPKKKNIKKITARANENTCYLVEVAATNFPFNQV